MALRPQPGIRQVWTQPCKTSKPRISRWNDECLEDLTTGAFVCWTLCRRSFSRGQSHSGHRFLHRLSQVRSRAGSEVREELNSDQLRVLLGVAVLLCGASGCFHTLPVFIDAKLAADPALPGLTSETLPWSATAIFAGWLVGSITLKQALEIFSKAQFLVVSCVLLCLCTVATVTLPHLTAGNIVVFAAVRFVTGLLFATGPVGNLYVQDCLPPSRRNQAMAFINTAYSIVAVLMATTCGMFQSLDWRLDTLLWCGLPPFLAFFIAFEKPLELLQTIPSSIQSANNGLTEETESEKMSSSILKAALKLAVCFLACGVGSYGLSYSAGKLSENLYTNSVLLNSADILGYIAVLGADSFGRKTFQAGSYLIAALSLLLCGILQPGSWTIIACAMAGRICLNVAFTTVYVALAEVFPERSVKNVLPICQIAARFGSILAPLSGTLPAVVSCPAFGTACIAAVLATLSLPDTLKEMKPIDAK